MKTRYGLLVTVLFLASLNLRPAIISISPLLERICRELGMNSSTASLLTTIPVLCMGIFSPLAVKLGVQWGIEKTLVIGLGLIGVATMLRVFTMSALFLLVTAFLAGVGIAITGPLLSGFIKRYFPSKVTLMIGVYSAAMVIGSSLSAGLTVPLESWMHGSWRMALASWSILAVLVLPASWFFVLKKIEHKSQYISLSNSGRLPWGNKRAWLLTFFFGLMAMEFYSISAWFAPAIEDMGYSKLYASSLLTVFNFIQIPTSLIIPILIHQFPNRLFWLIGSSLLELVGLILMSVTMVSPWISAILLGIGAGTLLPLALMLPIDETSNSQDASAWSAMTQSGGYAIGSLGPMLVGWIHDISKSYPKAFICLAVISILMIIVQLAIGVKTIQDKNVVSQS
jgi:MFS transporter, CP family, cyanate transporter